MRFCILTNKIQCGLDKFVFFPEHINQLYRESTSMMEKMFNGIPGYARVLVYTTTKSEFVFPDLKFSPVAYVDLRWGL